MRARGFLTFRLTHPVEAPTALFTIDAGTILACQRPDILLLYRTLHPYAIVTGHSAVEVEVEAMEHGSEHNLPPMNTLLVMNPERLRTLNQSGLLDVHNVQGFIGGTEDNVEVARPVPLTEPIMGDAAPAWNDSMLRITQREQARERQRADPRQRLDVNGNTFYVDARMDNDGMANTTFSLTSTDGSGQVLTGDGTGYVWNPVTNSPVDTSVNYDRGEWTTWFHGRGQDHEGERWLWRIRAVAPDARPCPECEVHARAGAERGIMVTRCALCRRQIMIVPAHAAEAEPVAQWTREPTLREVWAD